MNLLLLQTAGGGGQGFDAGIVWRTLAGMLQALLARAPYILVALLVFAGFLVAARVFRRVVHAAGVRTRLDVTLADLLGRVVSFALSVLGLFVAAVIIFPSFKPGDLMAGLGITSVAIGFAFKDVLQNFFAGILILWRRPFVVGDQIGALGYEGTVEEINVRSTRLKTYDGERAVLPNGDLYTSAVLVRTAYDKRRVRFTVGIGYPDSIDEARRAIHRVLAKTEGVLDDPGPWVYVTELAASSVNFTVYFWAEPQQANVLAVSDRVATGVKQALDRAQIDMPYPHTVVLFHDATGSRPGDIGLENYLGARRPEAATGGANNGGGRAARTQGAGAREAGAT
jgi:small conductance mechanosensitive channel